MYYLGPQSQSLSKSLAIAADSLRFMILQRAVDGNFIANIQDYRDVLRINYIFHLEVEQLYLHPEITALMPDLRGSARLEAIEHDVMVMNVEAPPHLIQPLNENISLHEALGWLFVAESSTLATAFLQKFAKKLGLTRYSGASHICTDPDLYFLNWRNFTATIDTIVTNTVEEAKAIKGTQDALTRAFTLLNTLQTFPEQLLRKQPEYFLPEAR